MSKRTRRTFTKEFNLQMVDFYQAGKPRTDIIREYDLTPSAFDKWIRQSTMTGSFNEKDNLTEEQKELIEMRKRLKTLAMENDILKQAAMYHCLGIARATYYYKISGLHY